MCAFVQVEECNCDQFLQWSIASPFPNGSILPSSDPLPVPFSRVLATIHGCARGMEMQRVSLIINYDISPYVLPHGLVREELGPGISFPEIKNYIHLAGVFSRSERKGSVVNVRARSPTTHNFSSWYRSTPPARPPGFGPSGLTGRVFCK